MRSTQEPLYFETLHYSPVLQVFLDNLVNIFLVDIGLPHRFRINRHHRALCTTIQAPGSIDPHPALTG